MNRKPLLTRKDIAILLGDVTPEQVRKNEKRWGLDKARCDLNCRCVRYRWVAISILRAKGFLE
jgi:hypothetical protein